MPGDEIHPPPSDGERNQVIELLRAHSSRLGLEEAERRMDAALVAPSRSELERLVRDLPGSGEARARDIAPPLPRVGAWRSAAFRAHTLAYVMVNAMLVGIYELTTPHGFFWPFFPIAGWAIGLAGNAFGVRTYQRHRYRRQLRRLDRQASRIPAAAPARVGTGPRDVVVMFTDVVDSTRLNLVLGDEDWVTVRNQLHRLLTDCYQAYLGTEVNTSGDGFLARFSSAGDAAGCACEIQRRLDAQRRESGFAPAVRVGIHAGIAIEQDGDVLGATVNLACRVAAAAGPRQILVTEAVADRLDGRFGVTDAGLRELKGFDRSAHLLILNWS